MKFMKICIAYIFLCSSMILLSNGQNQISYPIQLGNCTNIGQIFDVKDFFLVEEFNNKNLRKYFYDRYDHGYINITDVYSIDGSEHLHHKIEYFNTISSVRLLSSSNIFLYHSVSWRSILEDIKNTLFIAFGRQNSSALTGFEYDAILKLESESIQSTSYDNIEFELESFDFKFSYRTVMQNWLKDIPVPDGKLIMKVKESIYPLVNFRAFINNGPEERYLTYIEINMVQGYPNVNSFLYYPFVILWGLSIMYFYFWLGESSDRLRYKNYKGYKNIVFFLHWYYMLIVLKLIFAYIMEYYSYFKTMRLLSIGASFGNIIMVIIISFQILNYSIVSRSNECLIVVVFVILYMLIFYFFLYEYFWKYIIPNLLLYALFTNIWLIKFGINFLWKWRISQYWIFCIPISTIICCFQLQIFNVHASETYFNIYYVAFLLIFHLIFIALVEIQQNKGSRFLLPDHMRIRVYEKFIKSIDTRENDENIMCQIWMNPLDQPELEYSDNSPNYKWIRLPIGAYTVKPFVQRPPLSNVPPVK